MQLNSLVSLLGQYTISFSNNPLWHADIYRVSPNASGNNVSFHISGVNQPTELTASVQFKDPSLTIQDFQNDAAQILQEDYLASQVFERFMKNAPTTITIQKVLDLVAKQFQLSLSIVDNDSQLFLSASTGINSNLTLTEFLKWFNQVKPNRLTDTTAFTFDNRLMALVIPLSTHYFLATPLSKDQVSHLAMIIGFLTRLGQYVNQFFLDHDNLQKTPSTEQGIYFSTSLLNLIHSQTISNETLMAQQIKDTDYHYLLRVSFKSQLTSVLQNDFLHTAATILGDIQYCIDDEQLVLHCHTRELLNEQTTIIKKLLTLTNKYDFSIAISVPFYQIEQLANAYRQCIMTNAYNDTASLPVHILFFQDISMLELIDHAKSRTDINAYIHPDILFLIQYDDAHHSDLLHTLHLYLNYSFNTKKTARALHVHPNTLLYRINKIKKLLHYDFNYGKQNLDYWFSFLILYSQNRVGLPQTYHF